MSQLQLAKKRRVCFPAYYLLAVKISYISVNKQLEADKLLGLLCAEHRKRNWSIISGKNSNPVTLHMYWL